MAKLLLFELKDEIRREPPSVLLYCGIETGRRRSMDCGQVRICAAYGTFSANRAAIHPITWGNQRRSYCREVGSAGLTFVTALRT